MLNLKKLLHKKLRKKSELILCLRFLYIFLVLIIVCIYAILKTRTEPKTELNQLNENRTVALDVSPNNCTKPSILAFPSDGLTRLERRNGWITVHFVLMFYGFWFLASVCSDYLVPSIKQICSEYHIEHGVIGATIMAAAVSCPELFMNCVGTFVTKGDIGVSTVVGSAVYNVLAVPAFCGLLIQDYLKLAWWPITRDCLMYLITALALIGILWDGQVWWFEALSLIIVYFAYMLGMNYNKQIVRRTRRLLRRFNLQSSQHYREVIEFTPLLRRNNNQLKYSYHSLDPVIHTSHIMLDMEQQESETNILDSPWSREGIPVVEFILRWPITFLLWLTLPNARQRQSKKYVTFLLSIAWLAAISYMLASIVTIIGDTLYIPDVVMGLTIVAAGISIPEAVSSIIVTKQSQVDMGLSNSLGSNTFHILFSLSFPWFIKSFFLPDNPEQKFLSLNSASLTCAVIFLLISLLGFYLVIATHIFVLHWRVGALCLVMYANFLIVSTLIELNVFFPVNLPVCSH